MPLAGSRLSISTRLALWYGLSLLILLSAFVVFLYVSFHVGLHRDVQEQLLQEKHVLLSALDPGSDPVHLTTPDPLQSGPYQIDGDHGTYVRLLAPDGYTLHRSANFKETASFPPSLPETHRQHTRTHTWQQAPARSLYVPLSASEGRVAGWLEITRLESAVHRELHRLGWLLAVGIALGVVAAIGSGYGLARRALRPVATLTKTAKHITATDFSARLPAEFGVRDELTELASTFNALLDRLQASFERERRFHADAAHEMLTPLSAMQSEVDVALRRSRDAEVYERTLERIGGQAQHLTGIVDGLLELSRAEAIERSGADALDLCEVVCDRLRHVETLAHAKQIRLRSDLEAEAIVPAERSHIETILDNLLDNAIKYTPQGGEVTVSLKSTSQEVVLSVSDTGIGFDETEHAHLFDRFYRADQTTVRQARGGGLGLAIVKAIVKGYGGQVEAHSTGPDQGSTFVIRLSTETERDDKHGENYYLRGENAARIL